MFLPKKLGLLLILSIQPSNMEISTPFTNMVGLMATVISARRSARDCGAKSELPLPSGRPER
jgi:hypothetical protein